MAKTRKVPLRKCTACNEMKNKRELIRIVKTPEGEFQLDPTGKKAGRGAYICRTVECLGKVQKNKGLERSFKAAISPQVYEELTKQLSELKDDAAE